MSMRRSSCRCGYRRRCSRVGWTTLYAGARWTAGWRVHLLAGGHQTVRWPMIEMMTPSTARRCGAAAWACGSLCVMLLAAEFKYQWMISNINDGTNGANQILLQGGFPSRWCYKYIVHVIFQNTNQRSIKYCIPLYIYIYVSLKFFEFLNIWNT